MDKQRHLKTQHHHRDLKKLDDGEGGGGVVEFSSGDLQDVCDDLESEIPNDSIFVDEQVSVEEVCRCAQTDETTIELSCTIDDACISSSGQEAMQGDYEILLKNEGVGDIQEATYAQTVAIASCFQYPNDMYNGSKVCFSTIQDGFSVNSQCAITVGDDETNKCLYCRFCSGQRLTFNCTNIGYEDKSDCVDNNVNGSLLQFLYNPNIVNTCPTSSPTLSPPTETTTDLPTNTTATTNGENSHAYTTINSSPTITNILAAVLFVCHLLT